MTDDPESLPVNMRSHGKPSKLMNICYDFINRKFRRPDEEPLVKTLHLIEFVNDGLAAKNGFLIFSWKMIVNPILELQQFIQFIKERHEVNLLAARYLHSREDLKTRPPGRVDDMNNIFGRVVITDSDYIQSLFQGLCDDGPWIHFQVGTR